VRQPSGAFSVGSRDCGGQSCHASRITHHFPPITNHQSLITNSQSAFTLAEVLAALVFMAILIPVALEALSIATRAGEVAARKGEAALVAERVLNENVATTNWNSSVQNGSVRQGVRELNWTLHNDPWTADATQSAMRQLSVEVKYYVQGRQYSLRMSTLVDSTPPGTQSNQVQ
jgi:type II secretory pathway pseudopilin PulG